MEELEDNMNVGEIKQEEDTYFYKIKPKKRSLVERELETNLTDRITSPIINGDNTNTSRYGRARRLKRDSDNIETEKTVRVFKSPVKDKSPIKSPVYKMHASNSPIRVDSPNKMNHNTLDHQIESIYNENISLSRFGEEKKLISPVRQSPKVYVRKDLIQTKEKEETVTLIKNYSPNNTQKTNTHLTSVLQRSCEKYSLNNNKQNAFNNPSVVKTLDFDGNKRKKSKEGKELSKSEVFDLEAKCEYQVGDLAWAKMGTYPYWPCIVTRDPFSGMFTRKKLFGRIDREMIHVTFFGDNGRRSWIVDNMLRKFCGQLEFETTRDTFTPEAKKKDPRCAAFFVSEKKMPQWTISVEEAETLLREPKRLRIDLLNDMLNNARTLRTTPKGSRKVTRTDSDVSLSESLYDTLFSEDDSKTTDLERSKNKTRNKSLDVSEVVTACLDNMAAKTGITKIQKQSHMDRWLQKAKSKTPEKSQLKSQTSSNSKQGTRRNKSRRIKKEPDLNKPFKFTMSDNESLNEIDSKLHSHHNEHDYSIDSSNSNHNDVSHNDVSVKSESLTNLETPNSDFGTVPKLETVGDEAMDIPDEEAVISDNNIVENSIANSDNAVIERSEIDNLPTSNEPSEIKGTIKIDKSLDNDEMSINASESQTCTSNETELTVKTDGVAVNNSISPEPNLASDDSEKCKTNSSDDTKEIKIDTNLNDSLNTFDIESNTHLANEHDELNDIVCPKPETEQDCVNSAVDSTEDSTEINMKESSKSHDNETAIEDQEKQDVNIAKTIINDKLVGNVDINKLDFAMETNIITDENVIVNDDIDLKIPETNGQTNGIPTVDDSERVNNADSKNSLFIDKSDDANIPKDNSNNQCQTNEDTEITLTVNINPLFDPVNSICSDLFYGDSIKPIDFKPDYLDDESMASDNSRNNLIEAATNFAPDKDDTIESDPAINCNLYLSSEDDRSTNSTPTDINEFSNNDEYKTKTKFVKKNYKHLTLQDAIVRSDPENGSDRTDPGVSHKKFTESNRLTNACEEIITPDERSQNTSGESERSIDSNFANEEINTLDERSQNTIVESERGSTDSSYTFDSDNKSLYSDAHTETTTTTTTSRETTNTPETMDVDESTVDSSTQNSYNERIKIGILNNIRNGSKVSLHVNLNEEKAILGGDEIRLTPHGLQVIKENYVPNEVVKGKVAMDQVKVENDLDTASTTSTDSEMSLKRRRIRWKPERASISEKKINVINMENPDFLKYLEFKQDAVYDEHPTLSQEEITMYLYNTWMYEESLKTDRKKTDDIESASMVKGLQPDAAKYSKKVKRRVKVEKCYEVKDEQVVPKQKSRRRTVRPSYNEDYSDVEEDLEVFSIPRPNAEVKIESGMEADNELSSEVLAVGEEEIADEVDEVEEYFARLTESKPNVFKGLLREKVCEICEKTGKLVKCKGCSAMFHADCVTKETKVVEVMAPMKGRKKKKKYKKKSKSDENGLDESQSDEKDANVSEELTNTSADNIEPEPYIVANAEDFETQLAIKMKELLGDSDNIYDDTISSDDELDWSDTEAGKCEIVDVKLRKKEGESIDYSDFKCSNCQKYDVPVCFVCRRAESPKNNALHRQRCQVPQCNRYYHLECLEHWPQTQFNSGECARYNKKINEYFEALTCPRHVCHTCVSDDPRGCKTRFSGDKLARCVRCPATYHTFTKCLPAGSQILTGSHIICPRHHEHRPGKIPCHVNTGWCFICALGGTLICCEYCPTSFHAECLNIKPPEGGYMCEDCETGRLPLYGEMVWVKLGHYRWWPGIILHPCEIPENILAVKHSPGEFVVRFFGQYDHYWVNRGRVFPFQEGDSGKISSQKSKIDAAFTMAMEHAQRACEILKTAKPNEEESLDIASSLLPPHYVKLRVNKPCGALCGRRIDEESSLTQCECSPEDELPCGPYSHCLNRMLLTECGPTCRAGERCNNRAFEKRLYPKLVPYRTPYRGWGLKTLEDIKAGQFVIEYVGELIDEEEFQRRMRRKHEIRDENFYFLTLDKERMIDAGPKGNLARFMNHCCEPNCETQKWTVLGDVRVGLFALYDIPANSEVTFNYNLESAGIEKKRCLCGAKRCSGYIGAKLKQTEQPKKQAKRPYNKKRKIDDSPSTSKVKPKSKLGRPPKPKELSEIEKDLLIIKNATNGISSDSDCSGRFSSLESIKDLKASKRKRHATSTEESSHSFSPTTKKIKLTETKSSVICDTAV